MARKTDPLNKAFKLFHEKKDYKAASKAFAKISESNEQDPMKRARLEMFQRLSDKLAAIPTKDPDYESMRTVSVLMNEKSFDDATAMLEKLDVAEESVLYLKAEMAAEQEDLKNASDLLQKAISLDENNRGYAKNSPSFRPHLRDEAFEFIDKGE